MTSIRKKQQARVRAARAAATSPKPPRSPGAADARRPEPRASQKAMSEPVERTRFTEIM
jgi:hypothetical protein